MSAASGPGRDNAFATRVVSAFNAHEAALRGSLSRMVDSREDVDDCLQETILRTLRADPSHVPATESGLKAYLMRTARNAALNLLRNRTSRKRARDILERGHAEGALHKRIPRPQRDLEERRACAVLYEALSALPASQRVAIWLVDIRGLPHVRAARRMGVGLAACKKRLHRGRTRLRQVLAAMGFGSLDEARSAPEAADANELLDRFIDTLPPELRP